MLCQQSLDAPAQARFRRFAEFVTGAMNAQAAAAEAARDAALLNSHPTTLQISELPKEASDYLATGGSTVGADCKAFRGVLLQRRVATLSEKEPPQAIPANPDAALRAEITTLMTAAAQARALAGAGAGAAEALRAEHTELVGSKLLHDNKEELRRRIKVHQDLAKIDSSFW